MAAISSKALMDEVTLTANKTGGRESLPGLSTDHVAVLIITNNTGTTIGGKIEHSPNGDLWVDLISFTGSALASYLEVLDLTSIPLGHVRANMTASGGAGADVKVQLRYDSRK